MKPNESASNEKPNSPSQKGKIAHKVEGLARVEIMLIYSGGKPHISQAPPDPEWL